MLGMIDNGGICKSILGRGGTSSAQALYSIRRGA